MSKKLDIKILAFMLFFLTAFTSCEAIMEGEGDCEPVYSLTFSYDMNLKWYDVFPAEVTSVRAYAFDDNDVLVWQNSHRGSDLADPTYKMPLDLKPGKYKLVAWCGVDNDVQPSEESFAVQDAQIGVTTLPELTCRLNREYNEELGHHSRKQLYFMYHGIRDIEIPETFITKETVYNVRLTKDTNHIRIVLQHLSGQSLSADDFSFEISSANGHLGHDNSLVDDAKITYLPYKTLTGSTVVGKDDAETSRALVTVNGAIADLNVSRMMADNPEEMILTIGNKKTGETVARIPVIDYALLSKDYYEEAYRHQMTDQEFLDREDHYVMTLFLDSDNHWLDTSILIHSWRVVLSKAEIGS